MTGATGFLGRPLVERLAGAGHDVTVLTRRPRGIGTAREVMWQPDGQPGEWADCLNGAGAVIHLAGESIAARRWTAARKQALVSSRLDATRSLVAGIERAASRPRLLISASAVGYYGPHGDERLSEASPPGDDFLARLCVDWEAHARNAGTLGLRVVTIRSGLVLGPDGGALQPMLLPFRLGVGGPLGNGRQYWPWIHRDDWLSLVGRLLEQPDVSGPVNLTGPAPCTNEEFSRTLARVLHRPCLFRAPAFVLRAAAGELADALLLTGQRAYPDRALAMGFRFAYDDLERALRQILGT